MIRFLCIFTLAIPACQPSPVQPAVTDSQTALPQEIKPLVWARVPTTRVAVGQNVWLETVKTPETAVIHQVSDALNRLGSQLAVGNVLAGLPKQPVVTWQARSPGLERRVILELEVVQQRGFLEHLISRSEAGKDHESILSSSFDAEILKAAMVGAGLQPGKPARFINEKREQEFKPATGDVVKIYLEYTDATGKLVAVPAQSWVKHAKDSKPLEYDWVFAGSFKGKAQNALGEEFIYFGANDGRVVCLTNFGTALLDLPVESIDSDPQGDNLGYVANTAVIPERGTRVRAILEAAPKGK